MWKATLVILLLAVNGVLLSSEKVLCSRATFISSYLVRRRCNESVYVTQGRKPYLELGYSRFEQQLRLAYYSFFL